VAFTEIYHFLAKDGQAGKTPIRKPNKSHSNSVMPQTIKIGLWNIDHPELNQRSKKKRTRFSHVVKYLGSQDCDLLVLTESNSALDLHGYDAHYSDESPYINKTRCYDSLNQYHQVSIISKLSSHQINIEESINGLLCKVKAYDHSILLYGNVITIKDRWKKDSDKKYKDRLNEQLQQFKALLGNKFIIAGDFNLKKGWTQKKRAYNDVESFVSKNHLSWPTADVTSTVQHVIHSNEIKTTIDIDDSVQHDQPGRHMLSDHPFITIKASI